MSENNSDQQLEKILRSIAQDAKPNKNFDQMLKVKLRQRFYAQQQDSQENKKTSLFRGILSFKTYLVSVVLLALFSSTTLYAYGSDDVTNGSILYPLKRSTENLEELFATTTEAKIDHYSKMAKRRIRELDVLQVKGIIDETTIKETDALLIKASAIALEVADEPIEPPEAIESNERKLDERKSDERKTNKNTKRKPTEINLAKERSPDKAAEAIKIANKKTKRTKALEEISEIREEFEKKFDRKEKRPVIDVKTPIEIKFINDTVNQSEKTKKDNFKESRKELKKDSIKIF